MRTLKLPGALLIFAMTAGNCFGQSAASFPDRQVRIIVSYTAGGTTDVSTRIIAAGLEKSWGQTVVVENRPGAFQLSAVDAVRKAPTDGHTLLVAGRTLTYEHVLNKDIDYQPMRQLAPIGILTGGGTFYTINASLPVNTLKEFIAYAKKNPGKVNEGQSLGGNPYLREVWRQLGADMEQISYKGGNEVLTALVAGDVHIASLTMAPGVLPMLQSGKLKVMAYTDKQRHPAMPDVPTFAEATGTSVVYRFWFGLWGPQGMPSTLVAKINGSVNEVLRNAEIREKLRAVGLEALPGSPEDMRTDIDLAIKEMQGLVALGYKLR
jgi:tripartite-type tricarboxylate transporter receptor subunit TctC